MMGRYRWVTFFRHRGRWNDRAVSAAQLDAIDVDDQLERRIRKPVDLLRCLVTCAEIVALGVAGVAASATTTGVETDLVGVSKRLPQTLLDVAPTLALFALWIIPVALAGQQLFRRHGRRLAEAVSTGALAAVVAVIANAALHRAVAAPLYDAIIMAKPGASNVAPLDPYLAALIAYATIVGLGGRPGWRNALTLAVGIYAVVRLVGSPYTTVLSLLITLLVGRAIGLGVRYAAGSMSQRPGAAEIAAALTAAKCPVVTMNRVRGTGTGWHSSGSRHYTARAPGGDQLDVVVYDRDQQAAGAIYRLYRSVRLVRQASRRPPLSTDRTVERRALLSYAAEEAGAPTPHLGAVVRVGPEAAVLAYEHHEGTTLAAPNPGFDDDELTKVWQAVSKMHERRVTHRTLTSDRILLTSDGEVQLLDPGDGDVAASDLQIRLDVAQLLAELAMIVGPERAAALALRQAGASEMVAVVPLLQPVALVRSTRSALRRNRQVLPELRKRLLAAAGGGEFVPVQLERIRLRTLVTLVASVAAAYLLAGEFARTSLGNVLGKADWRWGIVALALSAATYLAAAWSLSGFVAERLPYVRTLLTQLAGSFVTLVTPAAVGGAALNIRYLQRRKIPAPVAAASVGVAQAVAFVLHILLIIVFVTITGAAAQNPLKPPTWSYFVLGLLIAGLVVVAVPAGRRLLRARVSPIFGQVLPRLLEVAQHPRKMATGIGGALLLSAAYILCLSACVAAFGRSVPIASIAVVYLTGSAIGSVMPTPGGLGAVEAVLTACLVARGIHGTEAASAVLLFRLLTFWLPVPAGWVALNYLERQDAL